MKKPAAQNAATKKPAAKDQERTGSLKKRLTPLRIGLDGRRVRRELQECNDNECERKVLDKQWYISNVVLNRILNASESAYVVVTTFTPSGSFPHVFSSVRILVPSTLFAKRCEDTLSQVPRNKAR